MFALKASFIFVGLLSLRAGASIGPETPLNIVNANIAPDGFTRSAVLAGGTFPGPVITGKKVHLLFCGLMMLRRSQL